MLAYVTGSVDQELLAQNEYLVTENRILRNKFRAEFGSPIPNASAWLQPPNGWAGKDCKRWRRSFDRKRFLGGTAG